MDIGELTINDIKQIQTLFGGMSPPVSHPWSGRYVVVRSNLSGVWCGVLHSVQGEVVRMTEARRLWSWKARSGLACSALAAYGADPSGTRLDASEPREVAINGWIEILPAAGGAEESLRGLK